MFSRRPLSLNILFLSSLISLNIFPQCYINTKCLEIDLFYFFFGYTAQHARSQFPDECKCGVVTAVCLTCFLNQCIFNVRSYNHWTTGEVSRRIYFYSNYFDTPNALTFWGFISFINSWKKSTYSLHKYQHSDVFLYSFLLISYLIT